MPMVRVSNGGTADTLTLMFGGTSRSEGDYLRLYSQVKDIYQYIEFARTVTARDSTNTLIGSIPSGTKVLLSDYFRDSSTIFEAYGGGYMTEAILSN